MLYLSGKPSYADLCHYDGILTVLQPHEGGDVIQQYAKEWDLMTWYHRYSIKKVVQRKITVDWDQVRNELDEIALLVPTENILIHCAAGIHRTGTNGWAVLRRMGYSSNEAVDKVLAIRPEASDFVRFLPWAEKYLMR